MNARILKISLLNIALVVSLFSQMNVELSHKKDVSDSPNDNQVTPELKIENVGNDTIVLSDITIEYYMFEENLSVSDLAWRYDWCNFGNIFDVEFFTLANPHTTGDKKANMKFQVSFTSNDKLAPGADITLDFGVYKNDWNHNFSEQSHWSYSENSDFELQDSVVVMHAVSSGQIIWGIAPSSSSNPVIYEYPEDCGANEKMKVDDEIRIGDYAVIPGAGLRGSRGTFKSDSIVLNSIEGSGAFVNGYNLALNTRGITVSHSRVFPNPALITTINPNGINTKKIDVDEINVDQILRARAIRVTQQAWPDWVFSSKYKLSTLSEVDNFIQKNRHLPGIPSEKDILRDGADMGEIQAKLLEKIEEMTLHMIKMNKRINELENSNGVSD